MPKCYLKPTEVNNVYDCFFTGPALGASSECAALVSYETSLSGAHDEAMKRHNDLLIVRGNNSSATRGRMRPRNFPRLRPVVNGGR